MRQNEKNGDRLLILKAKKGDMKAFEALIRKYQRSIYILCHRMTGAHQSADDLSQEAFIKAYVSLAQFKDGMNFYTWIRKIAVNNSLNYLKSRNREESLGERENKISSTPDSAKQELPQEKLQRKQITQKFEEALKALPYDHRIIFILRVYENQSYREIAELLSIPEGTVMSRLSRTRKKLRALLAHYL
jgi:RNA polymerase sigma-70 factor (ECF subfamily)